MTPRRSAIALLCVQLLLVLSIACKFVYERKVCPRVWVPVGEYDPEALIRGRYLAVQPIVDACALPHDQQHFWSGSWNWRVSFVAEQGKLAPRLEEGPKLPPGTSWIVQAKDRSCERTSARGELDYFIPEHAKDPFPLHPGEELWAEVTVPPSGPPRPIQLALSNKEGFRLLRFD